MDNVIVVKPDSTRYWVLDGRDERPNTILCEQAKENSAYEEQYSALQAKHPGGYIFGSSGAEITRRIEYDRKMADPESHWVVLLCFDGMTGMTGSIVCGPATFAECDSYTEAFKDDARGDGYFKIERAYFVPRP